MEKTAQVELDVIGDVHGCRVELETLLMLLGGYRVVVFVGDLVDRGPDTVGVLELVMDMVSRGRALCVRGNHEEKLARKLRGVGAPPEDLRARVAAFIGALPTRLLLDDGKLLVAHERVEDHDGVMVYGHETVQTPRFQGGTVGIDTGCVYGGALTALRYPELTCVSVPAQRAYATLTSPLTSRRP